jgi:hypothetical protein
MKQRSRTIRIFLCSTFRDFAEERHLLVTQVFPSIRAKLKDRFVDLVDVDLRWGITPEEAERGEVLPICLAEVDRARPYFIGMLGERYGSVPPPDQYSVDLLERQPWLKQHQGGKSITELEILHGVMNNQLMLGRSSFYFRSLAYARAKGGEYWPSAEERDRQNDLKRRIRESGLPVTKYANPEALARRVERDLWRLLDAEFPAPSVPDAFERESLRHEAYSASMQRLYLGGEIYQSALEKLLHDEASLILVEGASGSGKSALLANFFEDYRQNHPAHLVHEHYLAASTDSANPHALVHRLIEFIKRAINSREVIPGDPQKLMDSLPEWLAKAGDWASKNSTRIIFVLDSLNSLTEQQDLRWWPILLPREISVVVSCTPGPVLDMLKGNTKSQVEHETRAKWQAVIVNELSKGQSATLLKAYLAGFNKKLEESLVHQVQDHALANNPLFIRTLAEELRLFGVHEELHKRLDLYLTSQTIDDLFELVLRRVENDCGNKEVKAAMAAIWASRAGLTEKELLEIAKLKPITWAGIRYALDLALLETGGKITFSHEYMRKAVQDRYLAKESQRTAAHRLLARWFSQQEPDSRRAQEEPWQLHKLGAHARLRESLLDPQIFLSLWEFSQTELLGYWRDHWEGHDLAADYERVQWRNQLSSLRRSWPNLIAALADAMWEAGIYGHFGAALQMYSRDLSVRKHGASSVQTARRDIHCAHYLRHLEDEKSIAYARRAVRILESKGSPFHLIEAYLVMAAVLYSNGEGWNAQEYLELADDVLDQLPPSPARILAECEYTIAWFNFGWANQFSGQPISDFPSITIPRFQELVDEMESVFGREHRSTLGAVDFLVGALMTAELWQEAKNLAMSLYLRYYRMFGEAHVQTAYAAGKYGVASLRLDDLDSAEWGLSKASELLSKTFAGHHQSRTVFHEPLAETYERMGRLDDAKAIRDQLKSEMIGRYLRSNLD